MAANMPRMVGESETTQKKRPQVQLNQYLLITMAQQQPHAGWQAGVSIQERMIKCHNLITNIGLATQSTDFEMVTEPGVNFERQAFSRSQDKVEYEEKMRNKTNEFFLRRQATDIDIGKFNAELMQTEYVRKLQQQPEQHTDSRWSLISRDRTMDPEARAAEVQKEFQTGRPQQQQQAQVQTLQRQPAKLRDIKWSTISKDSTKGAQARDAQLLREFGKRFRNSSSATESVENQRAAEPAEARS